VGKDAIEGNAEFLISGSGSLNNPAQCILDQGKPSHGLLYLRSYIFKANIF
jgi:hypothetical protein